MEVTICDIQFEVVSVVVDDETDASLPRPQAAATTDLFSQMSEAHIDYMRSKIPMNRFVDPREIAAMVCWLASEDCSFSTGAVFDISGGRATY